MPIADSIELYARLGPAEQAGLTLRRSHTRHRLERDSRLHGGGGAGTCAKVCLFLSWGQAEGLHGGAAEYRGIRVLLRLGWCGGDLKNERH